MSINLYNLLSGVSRARTHSISQNIKTSVRLGMQRHQSSLQYWLILPLQIPIVSNIIMYYSSTNMYFLLHIKMTHFTIIFGAEIYGSGHLIPFVILYWEPALCGMLTNSTNTMVKSMCGSSMSHGLQIDTGMFR